MSWLRIAKFAGVFSAVLIAISAPAWADHEDGYFGDYGPGYGMMGPGMMGSGMMGGFGGHGHMGMMGFGDAGPYR